MRKAAGACKPFRGTHAAERGLPKKPLAPLDRDVLDEGVVAQPCSRADEPDKVSEHHCFLERALVLKSRSVRKMVFGIMRKPKGSSRSLPPSCVLFVQMLKPALRQIWLQICQRFKRRRIGFASSFLVSFLI